MDQATTTHHDRDRAGPDRPRPDRPGSRVGAQVTVLQGDTATTRSDHLATEEPLELRLRLGPGGLSRPLAVTMRTPGSDFELAAGFLFAEGVITSPGQILGIRYCDDLGPRDRAGEEQRYNVVTVELDPAADPDLAPLERHFTTTSACGVCGKASIEAVEIRGCPVLAPGPVLRRDVLFGLPATLEAAQAVFRSTGGLHAAGLFDAGGALLALREDVGRHNALDKLIGWSLLQGGRGGPPLRECLVLVSGRASFELVQKCAVAGVPILCAVSAPSSLAVATAQRFGMTLVGFLRGSRCNVYSAPERVRLPAGASPGAPAPPATAT